jgi:hypothetical protein
MRLRWNRLKSVRSHSVRSIALSQADFPETQQKQKIVNQNTNLIFFFILSIQKHETNKIIAEFKITSRKIKLI